MTAEKPTVLALDTDAWCDPETGVCALPEPAERVEQVEPADMAGHDEGRAHR